MNEKVRDFVEVPSLRKYIDFSLLDTEKANLLQDYVITKEVEKHLKQILDIMRDIRKERKVFFIIGGYGSGKSYFLVFLSLLVDSLQDSQLWKLMHVKLKEEDIFNRAISLKEKGLKLLPVRIDLKGVAKTESIRGTVISHLKKAAKDNLERELTLPYEYDEIIKTIQKAKHEDRERLDKALKKKDLNLELLQDMLKRRQYDGLQIYKEVFKGEFGLPPEIPTLSIDEILDQALKEVENDFDGIILFIDELQKYLEGEPLQKATDDLSTLEALCEAASSRPVIVVMSVLERELALRIEWGRTYDKLLSRFDSFTLTLEGLDKIILSRLRVKKEIEKTLRKTCAKTALREDDFEQLCKIYPINPVTFRLLKLASELRARERSAFTFLNWAYSRIMNEPFLSDNKPSLITPDFLYDYFETDLENIDKEVVDEVRKLIQVIDRQEAPYLKYMAVSTVMEHQFCMADITQAFVDDKGVVSKRIMNLMGKRPEIFSPIKLDEIYAIRPMVGRIAQTINERMKEIHDPLKTFIDYLENANKHISSWKVRGVERGIQIKFLMLDDVENELKNPLERGTEVKLLVIFPATKLSLHDTRIGNIIHTAGDSNVIPIFIHEQKVDLEILLKYFAAKSAKDKGQVSENDVKAIIQNTRVRLEQVFETGNVTVYFRRGHIAKHSGLISFADEMIVNSDFLDEVLADAFEKLYPDFSKLRTRIPKDVDLSKRTFTNEIIGQFFIKESTEDIKPSTVKYVQNIAEPLGFAEKEGDRFRFTLPTQGIEGKILRTAREKIRQKPRTSNVCDFLRKAGFPDCLIDMYLSALVLQKEFMVVGLDIDPREPDDFLEKIKTIVNDSKKGKGYDLLAVTAVPKEKWLLVRGFLKGVIKEPTEIIEAKAITGDQVPKILKSLKESIEPYKEKLSELSSYLQEYETKLLRIQKKLGKKGGVSTEIRNLVASVLGHVEKMSSIVQQSDPLSGFEQLVDEFLTMTGKTDLHDALYQIERIFEKQISPCMCFMESKEGRELPNDIDYLINVETSSYPAFQKKQHEILTSLVENAESFITSEKDRKAFGLKFKTFKETFIETYIAEHDVRNDLIRNSCKDFEINIHFKLLKALETIDKDLLGRPIEEIDAGIDEWRGNECDVSKEELQDILKWQTICTCGYNLKGMEQLKEEFQIEENVALSDILAECTAALGKLEKTLEINKDRFEALLKENNLAQQGPILTDEISNILENPQKATERQFQKVLGCIESLNVILVKATKAKLAEPKKPIEPIKLSEVIRGFKQEIRKTKATVREILEWIKRRHKEEEEILIDV